MKKNIVSFLFICFIVFTVYCENFSYINYANNYNVSEHDIKFNIIDTLRFFCYNKALFAPMVELVDTLVSGTRAFTGVQVQVLFRA